VESAYGVHDQWLIESTMTLWMRENPEIDVFHGSFTEPACCRQGYT
jgi:hypothetical protein